MDQSPDQHSPYPHHHWGGHHLLRWLIGLVILIIVFAMGLAIGRFSAMFGGYGPYHGGYGRGYDEYYQMRYYPPMMYGTPVPATPPANAAPAPAK